MRSAAAGMGRRDAVDDCLWQERTRKSGRPRAPRGRTYAATSARVEINMSGAELELDMQVQHALGDLRVVAE